MERENLKDFEVAAWYAGGGEGLESLWVFDLNKNGF